MPNVSDQRSFHHERMAFRERRFSMHSTASPRRSNSGPPILPASGIGSPTFNSCGSKVSRCAFKTRAAARRLSAATSHAAGVFPVRSCIAANGPGWRVSRRRMRNASIRRRHLARLTGGGLSVTTKCRSKHAECLRLQDGPEVELDRIPEVLGKMERVRAGLGRGELSIEPA